MNGRPRKYPRPFECPMCLNFFTQLGAQHTHCSDDCAREAMSRRKLRDEVEGARDDKQTKFLPTAADIEAGTAAIREDWDEAMHHARAGLGQPAAGFPEYASLLAGREGFPAFAP